MFVMGIMDVVAYTDILEETAMPFFEQNCRHGMKFQQDGALAHTDRSTR